MCQGPVAALLDVKRAREKTRPSARQAAVGVAGSQNNRTHVRHYRADAQPGRLGCGPRSGSALVSVSMVSHMCCVFCVCLDSALAEVRGS